MKGGKGVGGGGKGRGGGAEEGECSKVRLLSKAESFLFGGSYLTVSQNNT